VFVFLSTAIKVLIRKVVVVAVAVVVMTVVVAAVYKAVVVLAVVVGFDDLAVQKVFSTYVGKLLIIAGKTIDEG
jgi:hypothetical protein